MQSGDAIMMIWVKLPNTNQPFSMHFRCTTGLKSKIQLNSKVDWIIPFFSKFSVMFIVQLWNQNFIMILLPKEQKLSMNVNLCGKNQSLFSKQENLFESIFSYT